MHRILTATMRVCVAAAFLGCTVPNPDYCTGDGDCDEGSTCNLEFNRCDPLLAIDVDQLLFADTDLTDSSATQTLTVSNNGASLTGVISTSLDDTENYRIAADTCDGQALPAQSSCTVDVAFSPSEALGTHSGSVSISAAPGGVVGANISGTATARLWVRVVGTGTGSVTSNPGGMTCSSSDTSCFAHFSVSPVSLSASPDEGVTFARWTGECSGRSGCDVTLPMASYVGAVFEAPDKRIFVTSTTYTGNMGGVLAADAECQVRAAAADLTGTFKAWLSTSTESAASRMAQSAARYVRTDGAVIASSFADLTDGQIGVPIDIDEFGNVGPTTATGCGSSKLVWTATYASGSGSLVDAFCGDWTAETEVSGFLGSREEVDHGWTNVCTRSDCLVAAPIYCVEQ